MGYKKQVKATLTGDNLRWLKSEVQKRGGLRGTESEVIREAVREKREREM